MGNVSICRIGLFYDGCYFTIARKRMYGEFGWLQFKPLHALIEDYVRLKEPDYSQHHIVYAAWFQGLHASHQADEKQLKDANRLQHDLMHAGIDPKFVPWPESGCKEKGADVALAIDAVQVAMDGKIDVAVLVTGDGDFVPLARALIKHGVRVLAAHFDHHDGDLDDFVNPRLVNACNYLLNVNDFGRDKDHDGVFRGLFRRPDGIPDRTSVLESGTFPEDAVKLTEPAVPGLPSRSPAT